jgi:hypothetical protein
MGFLDDQPLAFLGDARAVSVLQLQAAVLDVDGAADVSALDQLQRGETAPPSPYTAPTR